MLFVEVTDKSSTIDAEERNRLHIRRLGATYDDLLHTVIPAVDGVAVAEEKAARADGGHDLHVRRRLFYERRIAVLEILTRADPLRPARWVCSRRKSRDEVGARAQRLHALLHKPVQPLNNCRHRNHG